VVFLDLFNGTGGAKENIFTHLLISSDGILMTHFGMDGHIWPIPDQCFRRMLFMDIVMGLRKL
jgi:hypothetical protein